MTEPTTTSSNVNLDILREAPHTLQKEWLNRYCQDSQTKA